MAIELYLGLKQLRESSLKAVSSSISVTPPPSAKRVRASSVFVDELVVLDALAFILSSSICAPNIRTQFAPFIDKFASRLESTCENFMLALRQEHASATKKFLRTYEVWTVVSILGYTLVRLLASSLYELYNKNSRLQAMNEHDAFNSSTCGRFSTVLDSLWTRTDPLLMECEWLERHGRGSPAIFTDESLIKVRSLFA